VRLEGERIDAVSVTGGDDEVVVARIGKPHGLHGEVTVQLHTDDPEARLAVGSVLATQAAEGSGVPKALTIRSTRVHQGIWLLAFEEIPDRSGAESLRATRLVAAPGLEVSPAQDLLVVSLDAGGDAYLPFVEAIVPEVDVERGRVVVDPPPGLLELNA
jgi:16S rRNA processing protein RimM